MSNGVELVCPAGNPASLRAAVDNGADAVYLGFRDATNARNFPGLNFDRGGEVTDAVRYAHGQGARVLLALNTFPRPEQWSAATAAVDEAAGLGVDAVILADPGLLRYTSREHPDLPRHLSVQASATNRYALAHYAEQYGVQRAVLPRVLSLEQIRRMAESAPVELEVFGFGSLCVMVEGRCHLSSFVTGESPNSCGVCSPAHAVRWEEQPSGQRQARLNQVLIDRYDPEENAGYPTLCKGRFQVEGQTFHAMEEPTSLNTLDVLPELVRLGIAAIKVEGRQRSPAYVAQVTRVLRRALDAAQADPEGYAPHPTWVEALDRVSEGGSHTLGALHRPWQ
jgi:putative protease